MRRLNQLIIILLLICCSSCSKKEDEQELKYNTNPIATLVYIYNNNVHTITSRGLDKQQLTFDNYAGTDISISYDLTKIAYLNVKGMPVIIDSSGKLIDSLPQFPFSSELHWAPNNKTLLFNNNYELQFWGPDLNLQENLTILPSYRRGFALSKNMDYAYSYNGKIVYQKANSTEATIIYNGSNGIESTHLKFSADGDILYFSNNSYTPGIGFRYVNSSGPTEDKLHYTDFESHRNERFYAFNADDSEVYVEVWDEKTGYNIHVLGGDWYTNDLISRDLLEVATPYLKKIPFDAK